MIQLNVFLVIIVTPMHQERLYNRRLLHNFNERKEKKAGQPFHEKKNIKDP